MDEKFTLEEQKAIASVLYNLAAADFRDRKAEHECINECMKEIGFDVTGFVPIPKNELQRQAYTTLKLMPLEKKHVFSRMMTRLSRSDDHFGPR